MFEKSEFVIALKLFFFLVTEQNAYFSIVTDKNKCFETGFNRT
jgi:hypothetical protein